MCVTAAKITSAGYLPPASITNCEHFYWMQPLQQGLCVLC